MNRTNLDHALYALLIQLPFGIAGAWWMGVAAGIAFFLGREHAQREKQLAQDVSTLKPWDGFTGWVRDRWMDVLCPAAATGVMAWLAPVTLTIIAAG